MITSVTAEKQELSITHTGMRVLFCLLFVILIAAYFSQISMGQKNLLYTDFGRIYQSIGLFFHHQSMYAQIYAVELNSSHPGLQTKIMPGNLNTPFFQLLISPLGLFSYPTALWIWSLFSIACALGSLYLIFDCLSIKPKPAIYWGSALGLFAFFPTFADIQFGQVVFPLLLLLCLAWKLLRADKIRLTAITLAIAACSKPFLLLFGLLFILRHEWRGLIYFMAFAICGFALSYLVVGTTMVADYRFVLQHIHWYSSNWNASFLGFFIRLFGSPLENNIPVYHAPYLTWPCYYLCSFSVLAYATYRIYRSNIMQQLDLDYASIIVLALLISPLGWLYYFPLLIIPVSILIQCAANKKIPLTHYLLICVVILLSSMPYPLKVTKAVKTASIIWFWSGCYFYALILLLFLCLNVKKSVMNQESNCEELNVNYRIGLLASSLLPSLLGIIMATQSLLAHPDTYLPHIQQIYWKNLRANNA